jgi:GTP-binding protein Era
MVIDHRPSAVSDDGQHRAGTVAIAGRPNVGKSTLLNALMGFKLAIVTPRPQTTRNRIAGIKTIRGAQFVFLDTPGIHHPRGGLNRRLVSIARRAVAEADVVLLVIDSSTGVDRHDREVARNLTAAGTPTVTTLSKMDLIARAELLPLMETTRDLVPGSEIVPVSALKNENIDTLLGVLRKVLPVGPLLRPENEVTDQTQCFIAQEMIREKVFELTHAEVPYATAVIVEDFCERRQSKATRPLHYIRATVLIERPSQKAIVIGERGRRLKEIGRRARVELEGFLGGRVFLELHVKVAQGWGTNPVVLHEIGL